MEFKQTLKIQMIIENKSKTIEAMDLKSRLKVSAIRVSIDTRPLIH